MMVLKVLSILVTVPLLMDDRQRGSQWTQLILDLWLTCLAGTRTIDQRWQQDYINTLIIVDGIYLNVPEFESVWATTCVFVHTWVRKHISQYISSVCVQAVNDEEASAADGELDDRL